MLERAWHLLLVVSVMSSKTHKLLTMTDQDKNTIEKLESKIASLNVFIDSYNAVKYYCGTKDMYGLVYNATKVINQYEDAIELLRVDINKFSNERL